MFFLYYPCYTGSVDGNHDHQVVPRQSATHDFENSKGNISLLYLIFWTSLFKDMF